MKTDLEPWKTNLEPWKTIKTNLNHWKPIKTEMEPWKTNLEPSKLTRSCRGWLWVVQVVTGNSQEEVIIFRDTQTNTASLYIYHHQHLVPSSREVEELWCTFKVRPSPGAPPRGHWSQLSRSNISSLQYEPFTCCCIANSNGVLWK